MATRKESEANARFSQRYGEERGDVVREIELSVIGGDWGANGYTTIAQADQLAALFELGTGSLVLDIGVPAAASTRRAYFIPHDLHRSGARSASSGAGIPIRTVGGGLDGYSRGIAAPSRL